MRGNPSRFFAPAIVIAVLLCFLPCAHAKMELDIIQNIPLEDTPVDMIMSRDGATAYILCEKSIAVFSMREQRVTESLTVDEGFTRIALSPDGQYFFLTNPENKRISILQVTEMYDMEIGKSPVIGKPDAPISIFAFFDFQ